MEAEIIPMCEDQGMAIASWASLGGGQLTTTEQREKLENDPNAGKGYYKASGDDIKVCNVLERLAKAKDCTLQDLVSYLCRQDALTVYELIDIQALAYLFHQSTHVVPIVGVQTVDHVNALPAALGISLSKEEIDEIHGAAPFNPLFPNTFLFEKQYNTRLTVADQIHYQMATWLAAPPKKPVSSLNSREMT